MLKRNKTRCISAILLVALLCMLSCNCYIEDYYRATDEVQTYFDTYGSVEITEINDGLFIDGEGTEDALIFYPGAKVEYTAYVPLMYKIAQQGVDVFIIKMPCNLAILGVNKADNIFTNYNYAHWYIGGHSLGGAMAASYAAGHTDDLDGLLLLAAYSTKDLSSSGLKVATVYGSLDGVLNMDKIISGRELLPADATEVVIDGGNHAQFGSYGMQSGDGEAEISAEAQQEETAEAIVQMVEK